MTTSKFSNIDSTGFFLFFHRKRVTIHLKFDIRNFYRASKPIFITRILCHVIYIFLFLKKLSFSMSPVDPATPGSSPGQYLKNSSNNDNTKCII